MHRIRIQAPPFLPPRLPWFPAGPPPMPPLPLNMPRMPWPEGGFAPPAAGNTGPGSAGAAGGWQGNPWARAPIAGTGVTGGALAARGAPPGW
ncbi:hypothetical protein [Caldinitratiruptor microaerophilus]|uniref:Uncharacterized protein n=1 Tax=Caldinitratiruptor microaerophilus TaxID=671077 RepID=A0AA35G8D7_9FIRM|nr:hypothetical protein [Caldinitratiruptor microaerophilus]BDG59164.1 hypothetical protein caldi_02540 [Caldinitratiruptor microaerophilus]